MTQTQNQTDTQDLQARIEARIAQEFSEFFGIIDIESVAIAYQCAGESLKEDIEDIETYTDKACLGFLYHHLCIQEKKITTGNLSQIRREQELEKIREKKQILLAKS